jgi:hypothetical protein
VQTLVFTDVRTHAEQHAVDSHVVDKTVWIKRLGR